MDVDETPLTRAAELEDARPEEALALLRSVVFSDEPPESEEEVKLREAAIYRLGNLLAKLGKGSEVSALVREVRPLLAHFAKAKTAKIVRNLIDVLHRTDGVDKQIVADLCLDCVEWARAENRTFLRHRVETRYCSLLVELQKYEPALRRLEDLLKEVKQLDDKLLLVEIHLIECQANFKCENVPKARASITASKTSANAVHCPPLLQAEIDLWSGILSLRDNDSRTAFSYLFEAFSGFDQNRDESGFNANDYCYKRALQAFRCQLLCRILQDEPKACRSMVQAKPALKYQADDSIKGILQIAAAYEDRSLKKLETTLQQYPVEDVVIKYHLQALYDTFVEKNLLKILEPFSVVEISHVAELIELDEKTTLARLSQMILDETLAATLDQGNGLLILYPEEKVAPTCGSIKEILANASLCVDSLGSLAKTIATS